MPSTIRVRYCPSPTGAPHVGNIRAALFDWLFARHEGGSFILPLEDTDRARAARRTRQRERKQPPGYDSRCRTDEGRAEARREAAGAPAVVRFKMPRQGETTVSDYLRGEVT